MDFIIIKARTFVASLYWIPNWLLTLAILTLTVLVALAIGRIVLRVATSLVRNRDLFWRSLVQRTEGRIRFTLIVICVGMGGEVAPLNGTQNTVLHHLLQLAVIGLVGWVARTVLHIWTTLYLRRFKLDTEDNLLARKHTTQSRILQRVASGLIIVLTLAAALMTFDSVRQYGVSLLASAGAAGIVLGLALQPVLKNLVAGIQLAVTQPITLEDAVIVEGEWGNVEEITSTYVVIRLWDWRRMVLPLSYFIEHPFQNWTRENASLIGTAFLHVDYTAPVDTLRRKLVEFASASALWDQQVVNLQVTNLTPETMELRMLISAGNAGRTFDLRCEVREKMIAWLQENHPSCLPRHRTDLRPEAGVSLSPGVEPGRKAA